MNSRIEGWTWLPLAALVALAPAPGFAEDAGAAGAETYRALAGGERKSGVRGGNSLPDAGVVAGPAAAHVAGSSGGARKSGVAGGTMAASAVVQGAGGAYDGARSGGEAKSGVPGWTRPLSAKSAEGRALTASPAQESGAGTYRQGGESARPKR